MPGGRGQGEALAGCRRKKREQDRTNEPLPEGRGIAIVGLGDTGLPRPIAKQKMPPNVSFIHGPQAFIDINLVDVFIC